MVYDKMRRDIPLSLTFTRYSIVLCKVNQRIVTVMNGFVVKLPIAVYVFAHLRSSQA